MNTYSRRLQRNSKHHNIIFKGITLRLSLFLCSINYVNNFLFGKFGKFGKCCIFDSTTKTNDKMSKINIIEVKLFDQSLPAKTITKFSKVIDFGYQTSEPILIDEIAVLNDGRNQISLEFFGKTHYFFTNEKLVAGLDCDNLIMVDAAFNVLIDNKNFMMDVHIAFNEGYEQSEDQFISDMAADAEIENGLAAIARNELN